MCLWPVVMDATGHREPPSAGQPPQKAGGRGAPRHGRYEPVVHLDLPHPLPVTEQEVALIARYLGPVIAAILDEPE